MQKSRIPHNITLHFCAASTRHKHVLKQEIVQGVCHLRDYNWKIEKEHSSHATATQFIR